MLWTQCILLGKIQRHSPTLSQAYAQHNIGSGGKEEVIASLPSVCPNYELARGQLRHQQKLDLLKRCSTLHQQVWTPEECTTQVQHVLNYKPFHQTSVRLLPC